MGREFFLQLQPVLSGSVRNTENTSPKCPEMFVDMMCLHESVRFMSVVVSDKYSAATQPYRLGSWSLMAEWQVLPLRVHSGCDREPKIDKFVCRYYLLSVADDNFPQSCTQFSCSMLFEVLF